MKQAIFITGFNNWGKTTIIEDLFNNRKRYYQGKHYKIGGINANFTVETHSNDDYWSTWTQVISERITNEKVSDLNLFTALCPTMHPNNNFIDLLSNQIFQNYDQLHLFLLEYKWEHHAKLMIDNIINSGKTIPKINFLTINADQNLSDTKDRHDAKIKQIKQKLMKIFP